MRTVEWNYDTHKLLMIDQRLLPGKLSVKSYTDYQDVVTAIRDMTVRGAPALGAAAAFGLALSGFQSRARTAEDLVRDLEQAAIALRESRPTAVNLSWALNRIMARARDFSGSTADLKQFILAQAQTLADEDVEINKRMAAHGAVLVNDGDT